MQTVYTLEKNIMKRALVLIALHTSILKVNAQVLQPGVNPFAAAGLPFGRHDVRDAAVRIDDVTAEELERQTEQEIIASSHWLANAQVNRDVM